MNLNLPSRPIALLLVAFAAAVVALLTMTPASAAPQFSIDQPTTPPAIVPDVGGADVTLTWHYDWATQGTQAAGAVATSTTLQWDAATCEGDNGGAFITGPRSQSVRFGGSSGTSAPAPSVSDQSIFHISITQDAPGERPFKCTISGMVLAPAGNAQIGNSNPASVDIIVTAKYHGLLTAEVPLTVQEGGPQKEIRYEIKLTNLGNSQSNLAFALVGETPEGWIAQAPIPATILSLQQGAASNQITVPLIISTPHQNGWNNDDAAFALRITPTTTKGTGDVGNEIVVPVIARVRGIYVPGPEPMLLVAAVLGAALVTRMVRKAD